MTDERKRHPSAAIPAELVEEIAYRLFLRRLEPPMDPETSRATVRTGADGKVKVNDDTRRNNSTSYLPLTRDFLRVLVDMGLVTPPAGDEP